MKETMKGGGGWVTRKRNSAKSHQFDRRNNQVYLSQSLNIHPLVHLDTLKMKNVIIIKIKQLRRPIPSLLTRAVNPAPFPVALDPTS